MSIKLGIDAKWYFNGPPSGRVVVRNIIDSLIQLKDEEVQISLFIEASDFQSALDYFPKDVGLIKVGALPNFLSNMFLLPKLAKKFDLDVVLFQNFGSFSSSGFKKVVYIHDVLFLDYPEFYSKKELIYFKLMPFLAKGSKALITISNSEKKRLINHKVLNPELIDVVYHGIDSKFKTLSSYSDSEISNLNEAYSLPERYILYVGRINIRKNLTNLVRALSLIEDKELKLVIVGKVDSKSVDIEKVINDNSLSERVIFTGHVSDEDLYKIYARAFIFCFPSFAEGFGLPPLEAMSCGVPVVVSTETCMPEVCGDAALYIKPTDHLDIAEKINSLVGDNALYQMMKDRGLSHVEQFTWNRSAESIINIVKRI